MSLVLGLVASVVVGQAAEPSLFFPGRRGGFVSVAGLVSGTVSIPPTGGGVFADLSATWYAPVPLALRVRASPVMLASASAPGAPGQGAVIALEALLDTRLFAVGVGAGLGTSPDGDTDTLLVNPLRFRLHGVARLGTLDGLHLTGRVHLRLLPGAGLWLAGLEGQLQLPLAPRWWLVGRGGGDVVGPAWGDVGVRHALGTSLFFTGAVGFALLPTGWGPALTAGLEWRGP